MTISQIPAAIVKVLVEMPKAGQGEIDARPNPDPSTRSTSVMAAAATAPPRIAGHAMAETGPGTETGGAGSANGKVSMSAPEQRKQDDDRKRHAQQQEQNSAAHHGSPSKMCQQRHLAPAPCMQAANSLQGCETRCPGSAITHIVDADLCGMPQLTLLPSQFSR
jgi:hypothetical protein